MFNYDAERQATEDAYQRSKANLNPSSRHDAGAPHDRADRGDEAERRYDAAEAEVDYQRSKAALNANHPSMQHHRR